MTGPAEEVEAAASGHREHVRELHARGKLRAAGEFANGDGFLEIFEADDLLEAQSIGGSSPLVFDGLGAWMVREWTETTF
ncbi:MAG: YciI family protein [Planctomycetota bacterium]